MYPSVEDEVHTILNSIQDKKALVDREAQRIRAIENPHPYNEFDPKMWCITAVGDALVKLRLLIENNFNYIETMGLVATTRYIFEINIWLNLFKQDVNYGLTYYKQLLKDKVTYWNNLKEQHERDIIFFKQLDIEEKELKQPIFKKITSLSDERETQRTVDLLNTANDTMDNKAARNFSLYIEQAKYNGFAFQAHLIKEQALPKIQNSLDDVNNNLLRFNKETKSFSDKIPKVKNFKEKAALVNMSYEYDFIFQFTSSLLHASPSSLTTNQKNLELHEVSMLTRYINVKIQDILDLVKDYQ